MQYKVCKFGGSSVATAEKIRQVEEIIKSDESRKYIVVSAPGESVSGEKKVTDHLKNIAKYGKHPKTKGISEEQSKKFVEDRIQMISEELGVGDSLTKALEKELHKRLKAGYPSEEEREDAIAAFGEEANAKMIAQYLSGKGMKAEYVDPKDIGFLVTEEFSNAQLLDASYQRIAKGLKDKEGMVIFPGFFGYTESGKRATFSRGGSDLTGAILAKAMDAEVYENWTNVDGILMADPRIVDKPELIKSITYEELRELSSNGMEVFHDEAMFPVIEAHIPTNLRNTNNPSNPGTFIFEYRDPKEDEVIVGIAIREGYANWTMRKRMMNREHRVFERVAKWFGDEGVSIDHMPSITDSISVNFEQEQLQDDAAINRITRKLRNEMGIEKIRMYWNRANIAIVGCGMVQKTGAAARVLGALAKNGVNIETIDQGASELSIIIGVKNEDAENAVRAIYEEFVK